jgi:signal transduction histidine kinase
LKILNHYVIPSDPERAKRAEGESRDLALDSSTRLRLGRNDKGDCLLISVSDTGCGISKEKIPHIFDPFFTDKEGGTGLGLAVTYSIIEKNGGKIEVESEERKGTTFTIKLPHEN